MKIAVLCGGRSCERDVSLVTGAETAKALRENGHKVALIDAFLGLETEYPAAEVFERELPIENYAIAEASPNVERLVECEKGFFGKNVLEICRNADIVFNALHGGEGENGKLQAAFDLLNIKYTGAGAKSCMLAMDKWLSKNIFKENGITVPNAKILKCGAREPDAFAGPKTALAFPCVVKPVCLGSSVGISIVKAPDELACALKSACGYGQRVIVEEYIHGREFAVGVLGSRALPAIEIIPKSGFYDYRNKYQSGFTKEVCPADISETLSKRMAETALRAFKVLDIKAYARFDFIVDKNNTVYCLEANTLPGMTPVSLLPQEAKAAGMSFNELVETILQESLRCYT